MLTVINEQINRLANWWDKLHWAIRLCTWPIVFAVSLINIVVMLPLIVWHLIGPANPAEIRLLHREELIKWGQALERRFISMIEFNDDEANAVLQQPRHDIASIVASLADPGTDYKALKISVDELAEEYKEWKGEPPSQVYSLCLHVSRWCEHKTTG